jgi:hypothetical protein
MVAERRRSPGGKYIRQPNLAGAHLPRVALGDKPPLLHEGDGPRQQQQVSYLEVGCVTDKRLELVPVWWTRG